MQPRNIPQKNWFLTPLCSERTILHYSELFDIKKETLESYRFQKRGKKKSSERNIHLNTQPNPLISATGAIGTTDHHLRRPQMPNGSGELPRWNPRRRLSGGALRPPAGLPAALRLRGLGGVVELPAEERSWRPAPPPAEGGGGGGGAGERGVPDAAAAEELGVTRGEEIGVEGSGWC